MIIVAISATVSGWTFAKRTLQVRYRQSGVVWMGMKDLDQRFQEVVAICCCELRARNCPACFGVTGADGYGERGKVQHQNFKSQGGQSYI